MFSSGDRVVIREDSGYYDMSKANPDSSVSGTIDWVSDTGENMTVEWDNGTHNSYADTDLELAESRYEVDDDAVI